MLSDVLAFAAALDCARFGRSGLTVTATIARGSMSA